MRLRNQVALVTGAGRGIGEAIARAFAREGARVAVADIDPRTAATTARGLGPGRGLALHMDVADSASVAAGFAAIERRWKRLDIAVTNAAIEPIVPFLELSEEPGTACSIPTSRAPFSSRRRRRGGWSPAGAASSSRSLP